MLLLGIYWSNLSCSGAAMKIWAPPFWQSGSCLIESEAALHVNICLTVSNLAYVEKKARGRLTRETKWAGTIQDSSTDRSASHGTCHCRLAKIFTGHKDRQYL